nr:MAG TPA: hypothetical protein [Caudoviricetes sp.]
MRAVVGTTQGQKHNAKGAGGCSFLDLVRGVCAAAGQIKTYYLATYIDRSDTNKTAKNG